MAYGNTLLTNIYRMLIFQFRCFLAGLCLSLAERFKPKQYPNEIELKRAKQQSLRTCRLAFMKKDK